MPIRLLSWMQGGIAVLLLSFGACSARPAVVDHEILARGSIAEMVDSGQRFSAVRSRSELKALYEQLFAGRLTPPPVPEIDFTRSLVVFVAMAQQPTAGYRIELLPPILRENALTIRTIFHGPPQESFKATVLTRPFAVARVTRPPGVETVLFVDGSDRLLARIPLK